MWIVAIDGKRIVIEAEVKRPESWGPPLGLNERPSRADVRKFEGEVAQIIGSIRFD